MLEEVPRTLQDLVLPSVQVQAACFLGGETPGSGQVTAYYSQQGSQHCLSIVIHPFLWGQGSQHCHTLIPLGPGDPAHTVRYVTGEEP